MKKLIHSYIKDENAGFDDGVTKIMFVILGIAAVGAIGYFVWNMMAGQAETATDKLENMTNPGQGNEFSGNPFN